MFLKTLLIASLAIVAVAVAGNLKFGIYREHSRSLFREQCVTQGKSDQRFDGLEYGIHILLNCVNEISNVYNITSEINEAKSKGNLDEYFKNNCEKKGRVETCVNNIFDGLKPCVQESDKEVLTVSNKLAVEFLDFFCSNEGKKASTFFGDDGPQCYRSQAEKITPCGENVKGGLHNLFRSNTLTKAEKCAEYDKLTSCVVTALQSCEKQTTSTTLDSLFKTLRNASPCNA